MSDKINAVKGMNDILPVDSHNWLWLEDQFHKLLSSYGYSNIRTPIVEDTKLFVRSIGEVTDIVEKEMYTFTDSLNGDSLTLRPEGTVGTIRAVNEHSLLYNQTQKLWYVGQMFRHERPQKGRYRQFNQLGVEALGFAGPDIDAEIIIMQKDLWQRLGINNLELQINCLGNKSERDTHRDALIKYFENHQAQLDEDSKRRLYTNPLRILDTKNPQMQELVNLAPKLIDHLNADSMQHYTSWMDLLSKLDIDFTQNHRLVRGLDYYNLSVFEWVSSDLGAQSTVCAGGRYDPLIKELGGSDNYAIGFALGIERLLLVLESQSLLPNKPGVDIYIANMGIGTDVYSFKLADRLRKCGFSVTQNFGNNSFKSQLKKADATKAAITLIIGENELLNNQIMVKFMFMGSQEVVSGENLEATLSDYFTNAQSINRIET
jgi:histidyl-tRNA synthetase